MNDRDIMENQLLTSKGVCDLYLHGSVESSTPNVHRAFNDALSDALCMQNGIYQQMSQRGWYATERASQQLRQVRQKFSSAR